VRRDRLCGCRVGGELGQRFVVLVPDAGALGQVAVDVAPDDKVRTPHADDSIPILVVLISSPPM
jgi:hypothetical protein